MIRLHKRVINVTNTSTVSSPTQTVLNSSRSTNEVTSNRILTILQDLQGQIEGLSNNEYGTVSVKKTKAKLPKELTVSGFTNRQMYT